MMTKVLIGVAVVIVLLVILVATRPSTFRVRRSIAIAAPPEAIFARVNDFKAWRDWSPWEKIDPNMTRTLGGSPAGEGATYAWVGNGQVGSGSMTIVRSERPSRIEIRLDFVKPFKGTNQARFTFEPAPGGTTNVTWDMDGRMSFPAKAISLFMSMDKMIGGQFDKGLATLKTLAEADAQPTATAAAR